MFRFVARLGGDALCEESFESGGCRMILAHYGKSVINASQVPLRVWVNVNLQ
jgi:hypothetical protein